MSYSCPLCPRKFRGRYKSLRSLDRHMRRRHRISYFNHMHGYRLDDVIRIRISSVDKMVLVEAARDQDLTLSQFIRMILHEYIRKNRLRVLRPT